MTTSDSSLFPVVPYPGLRPFHPNESTIFYGRTRHSEEIVQRLKSSRFVAVIGGSGSGKSSLIRAGVIPRLRTYGIPEAGDLWIPLIVTPGTNPSTPDQTPISRLARSFSALLKSRGSTQEDDARVTEIGKVFRQEAGFERLLTTYASELAIPPDTNPNKACVLFVIDQFEEVFHRSNDDVADVRIFVERIVDHFFNAHRCCYLVLTMRSEYLNFCPSFLELPDIINRSSYLVPRLDNDDLREAIVEPPHILLRYLRRQATEVATLPSEVNFSADVIERILADTKKLTADPDHLPLLQHLLSRIWQVACVRQGPSTKAPESIIRDDLEQAVSATPLIKQSSICRLSPNCNVLRECLENWPQHIYLSHTEKERHQIDRVLRQLAYKDPNTGAYTQQRYSMHARQNSLGETEVRTALIAILQRSYVSTISYLSWDNANPDEPTLKVSHESFIRGWTHFHELIDEKAERFEEFLAILRKCAAWLTKGKLNDLLLGPSDLLRFHYANLDEVFSVDVNRKRWFGFLLEHREREKLQNVEPIIGEFIADSKKKQLGEEKKAQESKETKDELNRLKEKQRRDEAERIRIEEERDKTEAQRKKAAEQRARAEGLRFLMWSSIALLSGAIILYMLPQFLFSTYAQTPTALASQLADAEDQVIPVKPQESYAMINTAIPALAQLIAAADTTIRAEEAIKKYWEWDRTTAAHALKSFVGADQVRTTWQLLTSASRVEPIVNLALRTFLTSGLWRDTSEWTSESTLPAATPDLNSKTCRHEYKVRNEMKEVTLNGLLFPQSTMPNDAPSRGLFFAQDRLETRPKELVILGANFDSKKNTCSSDKVLLAIPTSLNPSILVDSTMRYLLVATQLDNVPSSVILYSIDWEWEPIEEGVRQAWNQLTVITDDKSVKKVIDQAKAPSRVAGMITSPTAGTVSFEVMDEHWRVASGYTQELVESEKSKTQWVKLSDVNSGNSTCERFNKEPKKETIDTSGSSFFMKKYYDWKTAGYCVLVERGTPPEKSSPRANQLAPKDIVMVTVFVSPSPIAFDQGKRVASPIASLQFGRHRKEDDDWYVGSNGPYEGWIALAKGPKHVGAPLSTKALKKIGDDILGSPSAQGSVSNRNKPAEDKRN